MLGWPSTISRRLTVPKNAIRAVRRAAGGDRPIRFASASMPKAPKAVDKNMARRRPVGMPKINSNKKVKVNRGNSGSPKPAVPPQMYGFQKGKLWWVTILCRRTSWTEK